MGNGFRIGSVLGFEIRVDYSWFVIFFLILWSLTAGYFPGALPDQSPVTYLVMGMAGTLLFFVSLLAHELSHSIVARTKGIPVEGITLFIFGGVARTRMESERPEDELLIAGAGPLLSVALGVAFFGVAWLAARLGWPAAVESVAWYLGFINVLLAAFNLLPGFPLDGGRLFRALVWKSTGDLTRATRAATTGGRWLGYGLIVLGFLQAFAGGVLGGLWLVFIGWFLRGAAEMSLRQHLLTEGLRGVPASDLMSPDPETVPAELSVQSLVEDYLLRRRYQSYPVLRDGRVAGLVTLEHAKACPREAWGTTSVAEIMTPADETLVVEPGAEMSELLRRMSDSGVRRVLVVRDGALVGLVSASDVAEWTRRSQELGVTRGRDG